MENYIFLSSNFSISSNKSWETIKSLSSPLKSEKSQLLLLESQITINNDLSINDNEKAQKLSQNKSASYDNESQIKVVKPSNATRKRTVKRCQTTLNIMPSLAKCQSTKNEKYFVKKNNHIIEKSFEIRRIQKSTFTGEFIPNLKKNLKPVQVRYFRSNNTKVLVIEEDMQAIEFIVLALNQYKNEVKFDQSLYLYPNFTLAYQLEGQDDQQDAEDYGYRKPLQRAKSFGSMDGMRSRKISDGDEFEFDQRPISQAEMPPSLDEIEDRIIQIDVQSEMRYYKTVDLVSITDDKQIHMELDQVKISNQQEPDHILILVEDPKKTFFHIKVKLSELVDDIFEAIRTKTHKYPKTDYCLYLKYPCVHFSQDPLNPKMPIHKLPIHYLVLASKFISQNTRQPTFLTDSLTLGQNKETIFSKSANKSYRFLQDEGKNYDHADKFSRLYSYQEFQIIKFDDNKYKNPVRLGVDYFDLYYTYIQERQRQMTVNKVCKSLAKLLFEGEIADKDYRRIPINKIVSIDKLDAYTMKIIYEKSQNYWKELIFGIDMSQEKVTQELEQKILQNAFVKIQDLVTIRLPKQNKQQL